MKCKCGFRFVGPGEFRNCGAFVTDSGGSGIVCPRCGVAYVDGAEVSLEKQKDGQIIIKENKK